MEYSYSNFIYNRVNISATGLLVFKDDTLDKPVAEWTDTITQLENLLGFCNEWCLTWWLWVVICLSINLDWLKPTLNINDSMVK